MYNYAVATLIVRRGGDSTLSATVGRGESKVLVEREGLSKLKQLFPIEDGWSGHQVVAERISEKFVLEPFES